MANVSDIVYSICVEDLQDVALKEINRQLTESELMYIRQDIGKKIDWYEAIASSINELNV